MIGIAASSPIADELDSFRAEFEEELDEQGWFDAEFDAIIAAFDDEPPEPPRPPTGRPARWGQPGGAPRRRESRPRLVDPVLTGAHQRRQRSPPRTSTQ